MADRVPAEVVLKALRKIVAALQGLGHQPVAIGAIAHMSWGSKQEAQSVDLLTPTGADLREAIFSAARGEGLRQAAEPVTGLPGSPTLRLSYADAKLNATAEIAVLEASTPRLKKVLSRAQQGSVLQMPLGLATCDDLILMRAGSALPGDRDGVIELLRHNAGRIDASYLKKEAEESGVFDQLKSAWQAAKQQA